MVDGNWEKCSIQTGAKAETRGGANEWSTGSTVTGMWSLWHPITAKGAERYRSFDKEVEYRIEFRSPQTLGFKTSRIIRTSDSNKIYEPVAPPEDVDGVVSVLVRDAGETT